MHIEKTAIEGVLVLQPKKHGDERGFFSETFKRSALADAGIVHDWPQDNHSLSTTRGVVRGLHFQSGDAAQAKLIRVSRGAILDVVVDIRKGSPTFGSHVACELTGDNWRQLYAPIGMAHGFCTLTDVAEVLYKASMEYTPAAEGGLYWCDPDLAIDWPVAEQAAKLTARDHAWPRLKDFKSPFEYATQPAAFSGR